MRIKLKLRKLGAPALFGLLTLSAGYLIGENKFGRATQVCTEANSDLFAPVTSFSEVQNAKGMLEGLSLEFMAGVQAARHRDIEISRANPTTSEPHLQNAIDTLEQGMNDFAGTTEEFRIAADLLNVLKKAGQHDRWLQIYLMMLYEHPTTALVGDFAAEALRIGKAAGRQNEVLHGFQHVGDIPLDFPSKRNVQAALLQFQPQNQFAFGPSRN